MSADSDEEMFWGADATLSAPPFLRFPQGGRDGESESDDPPRARGFSSTIKATRLKRKSDKGVGTTGSGLNKHPVRPSLRTPQDAAYTIHRAGRTPGSAVSGVSTRPGTDTEDDADVEALIDTESDDSCPPTRGVSFAFSNVESRNASLTSVSSTASVAAGVGRKRTLEYEHTWNAPTGVSTGSPKRPRGTRTDASTSTTPVRPIPQTPSRPRITSPDSLSPRNVASGTPTISRVCSSFAQTVGLNSPSSRHSGEEQHMMVDPSTAPPPGVYILAHSREAQKIFDDLRIGWGVQYELARGVSLGLWTWDQVIQSDLRSLVGPNNNAAMRVSQVVGGPAMPFFSTDLALWAELDREEAALCEKRSRGLGHMGEWQEQPKWYGGKIQQIARLEQDENGSFRLRLTKMEMRKSHRFARFLGSRRLLQISVPAIILRTQKAELSRFFLQRFVLCGRVYVLCGSKDNKTFLMEIPEDYERQQRVPGDEQRISLEDFVNWHNPLEWNGQQALAKWATRFDLGYSISVPTLLFDSAPRTMHHSLDLLAPPYHLDPEKKAPAELIYTDGCGYMNAAALRAIARHMGSEEPYTAVQGRIAGAKGLWVLHERDHDSPEPKIWIRDSQVKIRLDNERLHEAHRIFDLLAPPRVSRPSRLSRLTIMNLSHNGVPVTIFKELMQETLNAEVQPLTQWSGPDAMPLLWKAVEKVGGVTMKRIMKHAQGMTRAMGLTGRIREDEAVEEDTAEVLQERFGDILDESDLPEAIKSLRDPVTLEPTTIHGVAMDLIQAGFHPLRLSLLHEKMKKIVTHVIQDIVCDFHISVPLSAEAFIVPDPCGVLQEGEIHFKSTSYLKSPLEDAQPHILLGDVLIYRNPNRLPSDVRKVKAVAHERLAKYTDVIVLPTKGPCSFASLLAGGDYDGDVCVCIYDPRIVDHFRNSEITRMPDNFLQDNFEDQGEIQQVSDMARELDLLSHDPDARRQKLQQALLCGLSSAPVGQYSTFHENAVYRFGYDSPEAIRCAFMFNTVLDSRKTGLRVKPGVLSRDKREYDKEAPPSLRPTRSEGKQQGQQEFNLPRIRRKDGLPTFVLDELLAAGKEMRDEHIKRYDRLIDPVALEKQPPDPDLLGPYDKVKPFLDHPECQHDLARIKAHIDEHIDKWRIVARETKAEPETPSKRYASSSKSTSASGPHAGTGKSRKARWDELSRSFASGPDIAKDSLLQLTNLEELKASWAYALKPYFAWKVAFQALCHIKARTRGSIAYTAELAELVTIPASAKRVLDQSRTEALAVSAAATATASTSTAR